MKLNEIRDNQGARHSGKRVGRGEGSGMGKTSTRGQKGLGARSGGKVMLGFEGGQNPLYRRLPIRGFNNFNFRKTFVTVNLSQLQKMVDDKRLDGKKTVNLELLKEIGFKTHLSIVFKVRLKIFCCYCRIFSFIKVNTKKIF